MKFLFLIILLSFGEPFVQSQMCKSKPAVLCSLEIEPFVHSPPADYGSLFHLCQLFEEYFKCMETFKKRCGQNEKYRPYKYLLNARNFVDILCTDISFFQHEYLAFARCFKSTMPEIVSCQKKFGTNHDSYFMPYEGEDLEVIEDICSKHQQILGCISDEICMKCGEEAKYFFMQMVQISKYRQVTCPKFNGESFAQLTLCELNPTFFCGSGLDQYLQYPPDKDSLVNLCKLFKAYFICMRTFQSRCDISEDYRSYKYIVDSKNFADNLCLKGGFLHKDYLRFAKCYNSTMPEIKLCQQKFDTKYDSYFSPYEVKDPEMIEDICEKHSQNVECISDKIYNKCGGEAKHVFRRIVQLSKYLQVTCPKFYQDD